MPPVLTPQQELAVSHRGTSVVLASGAGCGKTGVLIERYIRLLATDGFEVAELVAITFTERAARQMRERIRSRVTSLAEGKSADDWKRHLRNLETAPITTIHSFCGSLLRQHADEAGLAPDFAVLDDTLSATLRTDSLRTCLRELLLDESPAGHDLRELVVLFGWQAVLEALEEFVTNPDPAGWHAWLARTPRDIAAEWAGPLRQATLARWGAFVAAHVPDVARCLHALRTMDPPTPEAGAARAYLLAATPTLHEAADLAGAVAELATKATFGAAGKKVWRDQWDGLKGTLEKFRAAIKKQYAAFAEPALGEEAAVVGQRFVRVALAAHDAYRAAKRAANACDFQDLLAQARDLLRDQEPVRLQLQKRYKALLLDELQDTDPVQMELASWLVGAGLEHGRLFAVGDAKQSIYRFRGADVALFRGLRDAVPAVGRMNLSRNFRSRPGILRFVNALCRGWFPDEEPLEAHRDGRGPCVSFLWSVPAEDAENERVDDIRAREADAIARHIIALRVPLGEVVMLFRSMSKVAIYEAALRRHGLDYYLVGGRAFFAQQEVYDLLNLLRAIENPHDRASLVGVLRSPFCNLSDEAIHILAADNPDLWQALRNEEMRAKLPREQVPHAERAAANLAAWRDAKDVLPIARLLHAVFAASGYDAATQFEFLGDRKLANLWKLIDLARDFDRTGHGLAAFVARLGDLVSREPPEEQAATQPEKADVIRLMTIHQAKGLEFPTVIVPDLDAGVRTSNYAAARWDRRLGCLPKLPADVLDSERDAGDVPFGDFPDDLGRLADRLADHDESLRLFYVACTRAEDRLILCAGLEEWPCEKPGPWLRALAERYDLASGECVAPDVTERERVLVHVVPPAAFEERGAGKAAPGPPWEVPAAVPEFVPDTVALPALERGIVMPPQFAEWTSARERLDVLPPLEAALHGVLPRWNLADPDGWQEPLRDVLAELPDETLANRLADQLAPLFGHFAASDLRGKLLEATRVRWNAEFAFDFAAAVAQSDAILPPGPRPTLFGLADILYEDASGWHVVGIHAVEVNGQDPWLARRPGLCAAAVALGPVRTVGLLDLVAGTWEAEPLKALKLGAAWAALAYRLAT